MGLGIRNNFKPKVTMVADEFIDQYMVSASGEYVKVYLYLLRHESEDITVSAVAESLNHTEADVRRAIAYWEKAGVLAQGSVEPAGSAAAANAAALTAMGRQAAEIPKPRPIYTVEQVNRLAADEDFTQLLYIAQKYLNKVFTQRECEVFAYLYDGLHMPSELLEYVVEYCVQGGHTSLRYIETVALNWHENKVNTVEMAKSYSASFTKDSFAVMKAFGLSDRKPGDSEREMIERWFKNYGFTKELVLEACARTLEATHSPSFKYADKILSEWKKAGVHSMADIRVLDEKRIGSRTKAAANGAAQFQSKTSKNQFHNFHQRDTDYDALILQQLREE